MSSPNLEVYTDDEFAWKVLGRRSGEPADREQAQYRRFWALCSQCQSKCCSFKFGLIAVTCDFNNSSALADNDSLYP